MGLRYRGAGVYRAHPLRIPSVEHGRLRGCESEKDVEGVQFTRQPGPGGVRPLTNSAEPRELWAELFKQILTRC